MSFGLRVIEAAGKVEARQTRPLRGGPALTTRAGQYSPASMIVSTRFVTYGSAGSGDP